MTRPSLSAYDAAPCEPVEVEDDELWKLAHDYARAEATADRLRPLLYARIYEYRAKFGDQRGWQTKLVEKTGLTRERIRQIIAAEEKRRQNETEATR